MKSTLFLTTLMLLFLLICSSILYAQGGPGDPGPDPDVAIPFDGGISLLVAAGIGYAAKKAYDKRKKENAADRKEK